MQSIPTERLVLRRWRPEDLDPYAELCADPAVMHWIGNGAVRTREECATAIAGFEREWEEQGFGLFAVELRDTGRCIGFAGLSLPTFLPAILPAVEIGWRLAADQWGKGLATEAARAVLTFGFAAVALTRLVSIHQVGNSASARIMAKLGMHFSQEQIDPLSGRPLRIWEITRPPIAVGPRVGPPADPGAQ